MSLNTESPLPLSVEEVEKALTEIENKYSPSKSKRDVFGDTVTVLSKEFDSLGLPPIDCSQSLAKVFKQVVNNAHALVHIHRKTLSQMKDVNIDNKYKESKSTELYKNVEHYKLRLSKHEEKNSDLRSTILKLQHSQKDAVKRENTLKEELEKTKRYYMSKQNELQRHVKLLTRENCLLKEKLGKDINTREPKNDIILKTLRKYKDNEETYKIMIQKLQDNNAELLHEILDLREENEMAIGDNAQKCT